MAPSFVGNIRRAGWIYRMSEINLICFMLNGDQVAATFSHDCAQVMTLPGSDWYIPAEV